VTNWQNAIGAFDLVGACDPPPARICDCGEELPDWQAGALCDRCARLQEEQTASTESQDDPRR